MSKWLKAKRSNQGTLSQTVTFRLYAPFLMALRDYAEAQGVSQTNILTTLALRGDPELRERTRQYENRMGPEYTKSQALKVKVGRSEN
jgi:hypothetical protein